MAQILKLLLLRLWLLIGLQFLLILHFPSSTQSQQQFQPRQQHQKWINAQQELIIAQQPRRRSALEGQQPNRQLQPRQISALAHGLPPQHRAKIRGFKTDHRSERQTTIVIDCSAPHNGQCDSGTDFNPALAGGIRGAPGIKARLNPRAFQYLSTIFGGVLNYMIKRARLPTISQCLPAPISGCINVYNLYVSRYRCPQRVTVYPNPPNQIVVDVQNLDIGVTGNLGGQINILIPIALFGIVQVNAHQVSVRVAVTIVNGPDGGPRLQMVSCAASVGYVDVYIQNGGLIGDIANSQLRGKISEMVRNQIPGQLCQRLPGILDSEVNSRIGGIIPRFVPVSKLLEIAINAFGLGNLLGGTAQCPASCNFRKAAALGTAQKGNSSVLVLPPHLQKEQQMKLSNFNGTAENKNGEILARPPPEKLLLKEQPQPNLAKGPPMHLATNAGLNSGNNGGGGKQLNHARIHSGQKSAQGLPVIINSGTTGAHQNRTGHLHRRQLIAPLAPHAARPTRAAGSKIFSISRPRNDRATPSESGRLTFVDPGENFCQNCPNTGGQDNPLSFLAVILQSMDLSKLNNVYLNVQVMNTYATDHDFTIELNGEFSVCGRGCTPFGAFPMQFPNCVGCKMIEVLISDFTINSLLYHLHNIGFLRVRIGPETPKIGDLLKTTCGDSEGDEGLEDHGVETEDGTLAQRKRRKRQDAGDLASLGICLGDILPAVRERYPNERVYIIISTERAPSVILSQRNGGTAFVDIVVNADFYIQSSNQHVGTIRIAANIDVTVRPQPRRITAHAEITSLHLQDVGNQLGLPQDALDNLGNLGKEIILKAGNDALERGSSLNIPNGIAGLPISIIDPEIHFLEHALLIQADFTLNPAAFGGSEPC